MEVYNEISFQSFFYEFVTNPSIFIITLLTMGVIMVNGWTDAPNAIATCISTRSINPRGAIVLAAIFNFLGVLIMTMINSTVVHTIYNMVDFRGNTHDSLVALAAALLAIVLWATLAWAFGIPTSESHALIAGLSGAAIALQGGMSGINRNEWIKVIYGLLISTFLGFGMGFVMVRWIELLFKRTDRRGIISFFHKAQIVAAAAMAFMHGAQDGQKFMSVFMLGIFLTKGQDEVTSFVIPVWLMLLCSMVMALGTSIGGYRIIKTVGIRMVKLKTYQGFSADMAGAVSLLIASLFGIPVSTTHTKTTAIMGVGASKSLSSVNWYVVREMVVAWILTFPGCSTIGYIMVLILMEIF